MPELSQESAYEQTIRTLYERINYEKIGHAPYSDANYRLDRMRRLLVELDSPHLAAPIIHIAGTKGKGSTATFISRMLSAAGYRTGLYTSPHLVRLEERFRLDNVPCSQTQLIRLVEETRLAADRVEAAGGGRATFFELTTAVAFLYFAQENAQAVVLEVGLGGRLDSTNVCQPAVCVITSIGLDHQAQLGYSIAEIAAEKAGIIKSEVPVICSARHADARAVIQRQADQLKARLRLIDRDFCCGWMPLLPQSTAIQSSPDSNSDLRSRSRSNASNASFTGSECAIQSVARVTFEPNYAGSSLGRSSWELALLGAHQADNLAAALATIDQLAECGWNISPTPLAGAVASTVMPARLQIVGEQPWRIIDSAHNPDSIEATLSALDNHFPLHTHKDYPNRVHSTHLGQRIVILSTSRDKDIEAMLRLLMSRCDRLILTQYHNNPRVLPVEELVAVSERVASDAKSAATIEVATTTTDAWRRAIKLARADDLICATGSFFQAAELLAGM